MNRSIKACITAVACAATLAAPQSVQMAAASTTPQVSGNWAGYAIALSMSQPSDVRILSQLTVPSITCKKGKDTYGSVWVGFGGASSSLPQIGLEVDCVKGKPDYSIWYEWYDPAVGNPSLEPAGWKEAKEQSPLRAGDQLLLRMQYLPKKDRWEALWEASYDDNGPVLKWTVEQEFGRASGSTTRIGDTAECIVEVPSGVGNKKLTLTNFGDVKFDHCVTFSETSGIHNDIAGAVQTKPDGKTSELLGTRFVMQDGKKVLAQAELTGEKYAEDASFVVKYKG